MRALLSRISAKYYSVLCTAVTCPVMRCCAVLGFTVLYLDSAFGGNLGTLLSIPAAAEGGH